MQLYRYIFNFRTYLATTAAFAREIVAFAIFSVEQFLRVVWSFVAIADATTMTAADLGGLIVGFVVGHRDPFVSTIVVSLALTLFLIKTEIAGTHGMCLYPCTLLRSAPL